MESGMKSGHADFQSSGEAVAQRVEALLAKLTLEEKIDMLGGQGMKEGRSGDTIGCERVGIPSLKMADASVGVHWWTDRSTTYPATIALAATWDVDLAYRMGAALGRDSRARGIHIVLGPGVNIYRSALCGRNFEYLGEDPCLAAESVVGFIRGLQDQGVSATLKHYALNYQEFERHHVSSDVDERTLREVYLPAFRAAIEEAGSGAVMTSYNLVNGVHASEHDYLIREVLKGEWGFEGLVMSDWISTYSAVNAANAGLDLEMPTAKWMNREHLLPAVQQGLVDERVIDDKIRRLLRLMVCFGWLDRPQQDTSIPLEDPDTAAVSLEVARRGCVLLKNEGQLLPLDPKAGLRLAVLGSCAASTPIGGGGSAYNRPWRKTSILDGMRAVFGEENIVHEPGILPDNRDEVFQSACFETPDGKPGLEAAYFNNPDWTGEAVVTRVEPRLDQRWADGVPAGVDAKGFSVRWRGAFCPEKDGSAVLYQWFASQFRVLVNGEVQFDILDGMTLSMPRKAIPVVAGQSYEVEVLYRSGSAGNGACLGWALQDMTGAREAALKAAREADVVVWCGGHSDLTEGEAFDRPFGMPEDQESFLREVVACNARTVAVITAGGNVDMRGWIDSLPALLYAWYPGQEGGQAIAEILAGIVNPSGKLPATFERAPEDRSSFACYHDADGDRRVLMADGVFGGYRHHDCQGIAPLFAFGHGLSYTTYQYENLTIPAQFPDEGTMTVSFDLVNTGERDGIEIVQLYVQDPEASVPRPVKELKAFRAVALAAGQRQTVAISITADDLAFFCPDRRTWVVEPGRFQVLIGASAADIRLQGGFMLGSG